MSMEIQKNIPLAPLTSFKIGGAAKLFMEAGSEEELIEAVSYAKENNLPIFVLAGGSNILVSDEGFDGLVIKIKNQKSKIKITDQNEKFFLENVWAGDNLSSLVRFCAENSLAGLEWAAGIPGAVGGAVWGNAGAYGSEMKNVIASVRVLDMSGILEDMSEKNQNYNSKLKTISGDECEFSYRSSVFKHDKNLVILSCALNLQKGDKAEIEEKMKEVIRKRTEKIPKEPSPGSFFQNPVVTDPELLDRFKKDTGCESRDGKIPAGWIIDEAGLRGKRIGGTMVSEKHANFVINIGGATAQDVIMLTSFIKMRIRDEFGVQLKEEVQLIGF